MSMYVKVSGNPSNKRITLLFKEVCMMCRINWARTPAHSCGG